MKLLAQFCQGCRRHYQRNPGHKDHNSRARIYAVLYQRHKYPVMYRHMEQLIGVFDRAEQQERTHQLRLPLVSA